MMTYFEEEAIKNTVAGMELHEKELVFLELLKDENLVALLESKYLLDIHMNTKLALKQ